MEIKLFTYEAELFFNSKQGTYQIGSISLPILTGKNSNKIKEYILFLELVEYHLTRLNGE